MLKLYSDAAVSSKDHYAGAGLVIVGENLHEQHALPLSPTTDNHLAELTAFLYAVNWTIEHNYTNEWLIFHTDSQLVAAAISKNYIKNSRYLDIFTAIMASLDQLTLYDVKWIPEKDNRGADNLAKQALAKQRKSRK